MRCAVSPCSSFSRMLDWYAAHRLRDSPAEGWGGSWNPVGALVSFASPDPVGASPVGALVSFDAPRPKCCRTPLRLTPRVRPIRRSDIPDAAKLLIACDLSIASRFAMYSLHRVTVFDKAPSGTGHDALVQLVSFQAPFTGLLSAPADKKPTMRSSSVPHFMTSVMRRSPRSC